MLSSIASGLTAVSAALLGRSALSEPSGIQGRYMVECRDAQGNLRWREEARNLITTLGKNYILDNALAGSSYTAALYLGLIDGASAPTITAADTMASHAGWTENQGYSNASRPTLAWGAAASGTKTSSGVVFNINASGTLWGIFMTTVATKDGTTGTLVSEVSFSTARQWFANDTLTVTYAISLT